MELEGPDAILLKNGPNLLLVDHKFNAACSVDQAGTFKEGHGALNLEHILKGEKKKDPNLSTTPLVVIEYG